ncbi:hypothetical protein RRG08_047903 [Elysia crispata]|uniref:EGF-like domain-containing protein n=1 Tax=Elysia crispata TaxID=231223 RepID=A0AAE0ZLU8_9GAST|nr:hypothetical protein RRG08_047903 [Elysia crispata]
MDAHSSLLRSHTMAYQLIYIVTTIIACLSTLHAVGDAVFSTKRKCGDLCSDFDNICSGDNACVIMENCTTICNKKEGTQIVVQTKHSQPSKERRCDKTGKACVHGTCQDGQSCVCDLGYEGDTCADKTCFLPCQHGGTCYEVSKGSKCACTPDWQGFLCQEKKCTLQCVRGSCQYRPSKEDRSQQTSMYCNCPFGWTGDLCDEKSPETAGTQFVPQPNHPQPSKERRCDKTGNVCVHGSCQDGQSCVCDLGYEGDTCADKTCFLPCQHGGTCYEVSEGRSTCACTPDWQGSLCQEKKCTLQCVHGSCQYRPLKEDRSQQTSMYCNCPFGWTGDLCDEKGPKSAGSQFVPQPNQSQPSKERRCNKTGNVCVHGSCQDGQSCVCDLGYEGDTCADKTCFLPCQHGGTCYEVSEGRSTCACTPDWQGSLCQEKKCTLQCVRGSCQYWPLKEDPSQQTSMYCNCPFGWTGDLCDEKSPETAEVIRASTSAVGVATPIADTFTASIQIPQLKGAFSCDKKLFRKAWPIVHDLTSPKPFLSGEAGPSLVEPRMTSDLC